MQGDSARKGSEFFAAVMADGIGEVAVEGEDGVLHQGIDAVMEGFDRIAAGGDGLEGGFELGEVFDFEDEVPVAVGFEAEAEFGAGEAVGFDEAVRFEVGHVGGEFFEQDAVGDAGFEVEEDVVEVHGGVRDGGI